MCGVPSKEGGEGSEKEGEWKLEEGVEVEKFGQIAGDGYMIGPGMCAGYINVLLGTLRVCFFLFCFVFFFFSFFFFFLVL